MSAETLGAARRLETVHPPVPRFDETRTAQTDEIDRAIPPSPERAPTSGAKARIASPMARFGLANIMLNSEFESSVAPMYKSRH
ncbi:hypothetical protein VDGL01_09288 [Verticillium dahliae]